MLHVYLPSHHIEYFLKVLKGQYVIKSVIFTASSRAFLSETIIFFPASKWWWKTQWLLASFGATALIYAKIPPVLASIAVAPSVKKKIMCKHYYENSFELGDLQGSQTTLEKPLTEEIKWYLFVIILIADIFCLHVVSYYCIVQCWYPQSNFDYLVISLLPLCIPVHSPIFLQVVSILGLHVKNVHFVRLC